VFYQSLFVPPLHIFYIPGIACSRHRHILYQVISVVREIWPLLPAVSDRSFTRDAHSAECSRLGTSVSGFTSRGNCSSANWFPVVPTHLYARLPPAMLLRIQLALELSEFCHSCSGSRGCIDIRGAHLSYIAKVLIYVNLSYTII